MTIEKTELSSNPASSNCQQYVPAQGTQCQPPHGQRSLSTNGLSIKNVGRAVPCSIPNTYANPYCSHISNPERKVLLPSFVGMETKASSSLTLGTHLHPSLGSHWDSGPPPQNCSEEVTSVCHSTERTHPHVTLLIQHLLIDSLLRVGHCPRSWVCQIFLEPAL